MPGDERPAITQLLQSVAEQLKLPLTAIARQAELGQLLHRADAVDIASISTNASAALMLLDSYLLGLQLLHGQTSLALEAVSVSSLAVDTAHELQGLARQYGITIEVQIAGRYEPVMAHRQGLRAALLSLGYAMIESQPPHGLKRLTLAAHRTPHGIVTGFYGAYESLNTAQWRRALALCGEARQPLAALNGGSSAGVFVAEAILRSMETRLRVGKYLRQRGFATTLQPSRQLQLI